MREKGTCPTVELAQRKATLCGAQRGMRLGRDTDEGTGDEDRGTEKSERAKDEGEGGMDAGGR